MNKHSKHSHITSADQPTPPSSTSSGQKTDHEPIAIEGDDKTHVGLEFPSRQELEDQLTTLERKASEYQEKAMRAYAEMENLRRRAERDVANAHKFGSERLLADLLPVMDSLLRALEGPVPQDTPAKTMREGISLTLDLLHKTLIKHSVVVIDPVPGTLFNPELHEAMVVQKDLTA